MVLLRLNRTLQSGARKYNPSFVHRPLAGANLEQVLELAAAQECGDVQVYVIRVGLIRVGWRVPVELAERWVGRGFGEFGETGPGWRGVGVRLIEEAATESLEGIGLFRRFVG
jgi:hypothetical protein